MQLALLNFLLNIQGGAPGQGQGGKTGGGGNDLFAMLLGDSAGQGGQQLPTSTGGALPVGDLSGTALVAQEVPAEDETSLNDILGQEISADDAQTLLDRVEMLGAQLGDSDAPLLDQVKQALANIKDTNTPQTLGALIAKLPALQGAAAEKVPSVQRVLAWARENLAVSKPNKEAPTQEATAEDATDIAASPVTQSLQASMFRPDADTQKKPEEKTESADAAQFTQIVPLSQASTAPAWVNKIGAPAPRPELDKDIPAMAPIADAPDELPEVELPKAVAASSAADAAQAKAAAFASHIAAQADADDASVAPVASTPTVQAPVAPAAAAPVQHTHNAASLATPAGPINHAPVLEQVHVAIQRGKKDGIDQMTIQLEPADLGRVEVKMHTAADGQTQLSFTVDKAETLDSLARDARSLERALQEAGIKADTGSMQFNLRQQQQQAGNDGGQSGQRGPRWDNENEEGVGEVSSTAPIQNYRVALHDGVDIRA